jgi:mediator of RNA polymerase II transcription subunit 17, fungi type
VANNEHGTSTQDAVCDLIFSTLHVLLLRAHAYVKKHRIGRSSAIRPGLAPVVTPPPLLQPIVDLLQYRAFCGRVHAEFVKMAHGLSAAGVPVKLRMNRVGESGEQIVEKLTKIDSLQTVGGETLLRLDNR